jgi:mono/diheme cytochrome c family protein
MRALAWAVAMLIVVATGTGAWLLTRGDDPAGEGEGPVANVESAANDGVTIPQLSALAVEGQAAFSANCAQCHGPNGGGTDQGPPLIHPIYEPNHHADMAFVLAARNGSRAHHWQFGNMPPQPQVSETEIAAIIQFVREVQRANGIF